MYYSASDIEDSIASKVQGNNPVSTSIPSFDSFNTNLNSFLPGNMLSYNSDGEVEIMNEANMQQYLNQSASTITPQIDKDTTALFDSYKGNNSFQIQPAQAFDQLNSAGSKLSSALEKLSKENSLLTVSTITSNNQFSQLGTLNQSINSSYPALTPKGIRDLNDPVIYAQKKQTTVETATTNVKSTSRNLTEEQYANPGFNNSAQQNLQQISTPQYSGDNDKGFDLYVRRTAYWAYGSGTDADSAVLKSSTGRQLQQGTSVAVDPALIPYLSRIEFPDIGARYATDTGGAVKARTAGGGKIPVIDVFFLKKEDAIKFANSTPEYVTVKVYPPKSKYKYAANTPPTYGIA